MPEPVLGTRAPATLTVAGPLVFGTVAAVWADAEHALGQRSRDTLDLADVTAVDSAGLACVLAIVALGRRAGASFQVVHQPDDLVALAQVCEVQAFLA